MFPDENHSNHLHSKRRGIGLIELMIAVIIGFVVIGGGIAMYQQTQSTKSDQNINEAIASVNNAFTLLKRDLASVGQVQDPVEMSQSNAALYSTLQLLSRCAVISTNTGAPNCVAPSMTSQEHHGHCITFAREPRPNTIRVQGYRLINQMLQSFTYEDTATDFSTGVPKAKCTDTENGNPLWRNMASKAIKVTSFQLCKLDATNIAGLQNSPPDKCLPDAGTPIAPVDVVWLQIKAQLATANGAPIDNSGLALLLNAPKLNDITL